MVNHRDAGMLSIPGGRYEILAEDATTYSKNESSMSWLIGYLARNTAPGAGKTHAPLSQVLAGKKIPASLSGVSSLQIHCLSRMMKCMVCVEPTGFC